MVVVVTTARKRLGILVGDGQAGAARTAAIGGCQSSYHGKTVVRRAAS